MKSQGDKGTLFNCVMMNPVNELRFFQVMSNTNNTFPSFGNEQLTT